jgi:hypothetical protein
MSTSLTTRPPAIGGLPSLPSLPRGYNGSLVCLMMYVYVVDLAPNNELCSPGGVNDFRDQNLSPRGLGDFESLSADAGARREAEVERDGNLRLLRADGMLFALPLP